MLDHKFDNNGEQCHDQCQRKWHGPTGQVQENIELRGLGVPRKQAQNGQTTESENVPSVERLDRRDGLSYARA